MSHLCNPLEARQFLQVKLKFARIETSTDGLRIRKGFSQLARAIPTLVCLMDRCIRPIASLSCQVIYGAHSLSYDQILAAEL
jgi:hypothetical protein